MSEGPNQMTLDEELHCMLTAIRMHKGEVDEQAFIAAIKRALQKRLPEDKQTVGDIHQLERIERAGYNHALEDVKKAYSLGRVNGQKLR